MGIETAIAVQPVNPLIMPMSCPNQFANKGVMRANATIDPATVAAVHGQHLYSYAHVGTVPSERTPGAVKVNSPDCARVSA